MKTIHKWLVCTVVCSLAIAGCTSKVTEKDQFSGFLPSYDGLQQVTSPSGHAVLRWVAPDFKPTSYDTVVFDRLQIYPAPKPNERVNLQTLQEIQAFANDSVNSVLSQKYQVVRTVQSVPNGARAMIMRTAITGVTASNEGMRWYEIVPIAAVVGATEALTGHRTQDTELYVEADFVDAVSGKPLARVVRKIFGTTLKNDSQEITANDFKAAIRDTMRDLQALLK
jgi:hypothetical protein